ncbi:zinc finger protein 383-like isoform X1 [Bactrocera tryoni]|uniref:zinc finger protein 383-like isoform X1 n=1 Tax=Bactrocera tryoni TaxID=59916 RepID=UPI001A990065|nr:zinc finger protein 383-like isoform X1 [Bactrocera tryoni]
MSKNIQLICRVCLRKCKSRHVSLLEVFQINAEQASVTYAEAYKDCTQLEIEIGVDGLPVWLCNSCSRDLQYAYEFRIKAKKSAGTLLIQIRAQNEEKSRRVPSPSEFELPDNNAALGYALADADVIDACSRQVMECDKDPLEESDSDNEVRGEVAPAINKLESHTSSQTNSDFIYDSEDEKPLKLLMTGNQSEVVSPFEKDQCSFDDDDEFIAEENTTKEKVTDPMFSPEAQIFPKGRFKCAICEQRYFTAAGLKAHMEVHLAKSCITKKKRGRNKQRKAPKKVNINEDCENLILNPTNDDEKLATEETKYQQEQQSHEKPPKSKEPKPKRMFPCHVCGKHMISASKLRYHMVMHTGEKDYLCTMCPKAYSTIYALKHHIRTHTGERPYECKFCGDRFLRPTTLKSHQRRHTGERPYGCDICGKRFIQHSSMTTHMKLNHMDKTIQCPHCDKKYARQTDLNTHLLSHTGDKPYSCQLCPSRFVRQANLNKHMNQQHAEKTNLSKCTQLIDDAKAEANGSVAVPDKSHDYTVGKLTDKSMLSEAMTSDFVDKCYNFNSSSNAEDSSKDQPIHAAAEKDFAQLDNDLVHWN